MLDFTAFLFAVGPAAIFITKAVDAVRSLDKNDSWPGGLWIVLALSFGVVYALLTGVNFVGMIGGLAPNVSDALTGWWGVLLTGLAIGATGSFWHEHMDWASGRAKAAKAASMMPTPTVTRTK